MAGETNERRARIRLRSWLVLGVGLGMAAFLAVTMGGLLILYRWTGASTDYAPPQRFAPPRLETDPAADLAAFRAKQRAQLEAGQEAGGTRRLSIERAMDLIARRGAAAYAPLQPAPPTPLPVRAEETR